MAFDERQRRRVAQHLANFDFATLFREELGWDLPPVGIQPLIMTLDERTYTLTPVIHKRDFYLFLCTADDGAIPLSNARNKIETWLSKRNREHLIVFVDGHNASQRNRQEWQWVRREIGQPLRRRGERYDKGQNPERLIQKLDALQVALDEEDDITLVDVAGRVRAAFNVDQVTKRFYDNFRQERDRFAKFVEGIAESGILDWYVSIMLNRLMFVYFIQKKGFLDNDTDYLRNRMHRLQREQGEDQFYSFYRYFLLRLFHEGLGQPTRTPELDALLGKIPYLNGGIFQLHEIEETHPDIQIPDAAFSQIINFFDQYDWHLDDRPLRQGNEINPDVLGYIFERYINQKQMGAYYTKEDITEYICQNTIIPYLFDALNKKVATAFEPHGLIWSLLKDDPDRYIYAAVRHGREHELPPEIAAGVAQVSQRTTWNTPTPASHGLPTEIWRETVARRQRYADVRAKLANGDVTQINDLITYNLDIKQFAQDVVENCEGADLLNALWQVLTTMSVLDPTCGSGAFLFAGLNILQPLYEAAIARMEAMLAEPGFVRLHPNYARNFQAVLDQIARHPNRAYFVLKSIMINNLYGVDIMAEATEICKLRLFLKLAAQVAKNDRRPNLGIEPLPDIDFNIRAGNTLVGFATYGEVERAINRKFDFDNMLGQIQEKAQAVERLTKLFRDQQTTHGGEVTVADKHALRAKLHELEAILNRYLADEYAVNPDDAKAYGKWLASHQPFHWFIEFYGIVQERGGFDVIVGNPPYVVYSNVRQDYQVQNFATESAGDVYAFIMEQSYKLVADGRYLSMIVPISIFGVDGFEILQRLTLSKFSELWVSCFANRPSQLFLGAQKRLTIIIGKVGDCLPKIHTSSYIRWTKDERNFLLRVKLSYITPSSSYQVFPASLEKLGTLHEFTAFNKLVMVKEKLELSVMSNTKHKMYYTRKFGYFLAFLDFVPSITTISTGEKQLPSELKELNFNNSNNVNSVIAALTSSTFFWFWNVLSDCRNLNRRDLLAFPYSPVDVADEVNVELAKLGSHYIKKLKGTSRLMTKSGKHIETFKYSSLKPIIDQIDTVLAQHYGFTDEELDFIINYDIKYRMGDDLVEDE